MEFLLGILIGLVFGWTFATPEWFTRVYENARKRFGGGGQND